jgi:protein-S-isoprenylcysteine O-methyltransferase Ste14
LVTGRDTVSAGRWRHILIVDHMADRSNSRRMSERRSAIYYNQRWRLYALRTFALAMIVMVLIAEPVWQDAAIQTGIKLLGAALVVSAALGRLWSTLYIGGKKNITLITKGPYSVTRNPLYFFSTAGSVGAGLVFGSFVLGGLAGCMTGAILYVTSRGEARLLHSHFGTRYQDYATRVPLFWPDPRLYEDERDPTFSPHALKRGLGDAVLFLLVIPLAEVLEYLRGLDLLPRVLALY